MPEWDPNPPLRTIRSSEGGDEGSDPEARYQGSVEQADRQACAESRRDASSDAVLEHGERAERAGQAHRGSDRDVETAGDQREGLPDGDHGQRSTLPSHVLDVPPGGETIGIEGCEYGRNENDPDGELNLDRSQIDPPDQVQGSEPRDTRLHPSPGCGFRRHRPEQL